MFKRLRKSIYSILFPSFSELDLGVFLYLFIIAGFERRDVLLIEISRYFVNREAGLYIFSGIMVFSILIYVVRIIKHVFTRQSATSKEKTLFIYVFYTILSISALISLLERTLVEEAAWSGLLNPIFNYFLIIRSILLMFVFNRNGNTVIQIDTYTSDQLTKYELILLLFACPILYYFFRGSNLWVTSIIYSYFYATSSILFSRSLFKNPEIQN